MSAALLTPTRFAGLPRHRARVTLVVLILLPILVTLTSTLAAPTADAARSPILQQTIVDAIHHGSDYYSATAEVLRQAGLPLSPLTAPLPTLAMAAAYLPPALLALLLYALVAITLYVWHDRLRPVFVRKGVRYAATFLLAGGMIAFARADLIVIPELWAGVLIALALAVWRADRWVEPAALALAAMLLADAAVLFAATMLVFAVRERRWAETRGWIAALAIFAIALAAHFHALAAIAHPLAAGAPALPDAADRFGGIIRATVLAPFPSTIGVLVFALSLFGWAAWRAPTGLRALATLLIYTALPAVVAGPDTDYWGLLVAPLSLLGLAFAPDGVRDLVASARRRRVTVMRKAA